MNEARIKSLIDRFLAWQLPVTVCSDTCVVDRNYPFSRSGTNLLTADEARQMVEHLLADERPGLAIFRLKAKIDLRLNNHLCDMKPDYDDSIVGFNEAWDIIRAIFEEEGICALPVE